MIFELINLLGVDILFNVSDIFSKDVLIDNLIWRELVADFRESFSERAEFISK